MDKRLIQAIQNIEDALLQGRELKISLTLNPGEWAEVDIAVEELVTARPNQLILIVSGGGYESFEDAIIAIGENLNG